MENEIQETKLEENVASQLSLTGRSGVWWIVLIRGILALVLGLYAIFSPGKMLVAFVLVTGAFWLLDGIILLFASISGQVVKTNPWWAGLRAVIGILAGIAVFSQPVLSTVFIVWLIVIILGIVTIISGVEEFIRGIKSSKGWLVAGGIFYVLFGIIVIHTPLLAAAVLARFIGIIAAISGLALILFSFLLLSAGKEIEVE